MKNLPVKYIGGWGYRSQSYRSCPYDTITPYQAYQQSPDQLHHTILDTLTEPSLLIGWSMGGFLALECAQTNPKNIAGLVILAAGLRYTANEAFPGGVPKAALLAMKKALAQNPIQTLKNFHQAGAHPEPFHESLFDLDTAYLSHGLDYLLHIDIPSPPTGIPMLIIHGEQDQITPSTIGKNLHQSAPNSTMRLLPQAGHALPFMPQEPLWAGIAEWINHAKT